MKENKPLGQKSYGSIPHLSGSRMGPADHHIHEGQEKICTVKARKGDVVIVTEKLDGSCMAVANLDGNILALGRSGYLARTSRFEQHHMFADWVDRQCKLFEHLKPGQRLVGEWMAQAHGTRYEDITSPWFVFDLMAGNKRASYEELCRLASGWFFMPKVLSRDGALSAEEAMVILGDRGNEKAIDKPEGAVWRVETNGEFNYMAKYVRPDKQDGIYLPEISGKEAIWNWQPIK